MKARLRGAICVALALVSVGPAFAGYPYLDEIDPVAHVFELREPLGHDWEREVVSWPVPRGVKPRDVRLLDEDGCFLPTQLTSTKRGIRRRWRVHALIDLPADSVRQFTLARDPCPTVSDLVVEEGESLVLLRNSHVAVTIPRWQGATAAGPLREFAPPFRSVGRPGGEELGQCAWVDTNGLLDVVEARTELVCAGPVFAEVRQRLSFANGGRYEMTLRLAASQELVSITEWSDVSAPGVGVRFAPAAGMKADRLFHHLSRRGASPVGEPVSELADGPVLRLRPWSYWWLPRISQFAGFYGEGGEDFLGVLLMRPSRWSPVRWAGFDRTEVTVDKSGDSLGMLFELAADVPTGQAGVAGAIALSAEERLDARGDDRALSRVWAIVVGHVADHVGAENPCRMRQLLVKHGEFPLDEVKDFGFDLFARDPVAGHPRLLIGEDDIRRSREQAATNAWLKTRIAASVRYADHGRSAIENEGGRAFYEQAYVPMSMREEVPEAYLGSPDPVYGRMLAPVVRGVAAELRRGLLTPSVASLGTHGPWFTHLPMQLALLYDLIAGKELLSQDEDLLVRNTLVLSGHMLAHGDYWNTGCGLASANPNMTSSIRLPLGVIGLLLQGHPRADEWAAVAEKELRDELVEWVGEEGAWVECPGYQNATMDGVLLLAQAMKNIKGVDLFLHPKLKATMDYWGFLLTPPDPRFPAEMYREPNPRRRWPFNIVGGQAPMTLPSIGDTFAGRIVPWHGWMARATAETDPAYSAVQQFYWKSQLQFYGTGGRVTGLLPALTDTDLPSAPPADLDRGYPGFGSVMRTSWTEPKATYVAHRTGPFIHHYHDDFNSFVLYAKGAPLCLDFGNLYQPVRRQEPWYHNRVSLSVDSETRVPGGRGELVDFRSLRRTIAWSHGFEWFGSRDEAGNHRHLVMLKSDDPLGASYVVMRDRTRSTLPELDTFYLNLWCHADAPELTSVQDDGGAHMLVSFPGLYGVDLDAHVLSPREVTVTTNYWEWAKYIYVWKDFSESQHGVHIAKAKDAGDFVTVLYPRADVQGPGNGCATHDGALVTWQHMEGVDELLLSPGEATELTGMWSDLGGEIAFARRYDDDRLRLAVLLGKDAFAGIGGWRLASDGPTALEVGPEGVRGESSGIAHTAVIHSPGDGAYGDVLLDGEPHRCERREGRIRIELPAGYHQFAIARRTGG